MLESLDEIKMWKDKYQILETILINWKYCIDKNEMIIPLLKLLTISIISIFNYKIINSI